MGLPQARGLRLDGRAGPSRWASRGGPLPGSGPLRQSDQSNKVVGPEVPIS